MSSIFPDAGPGTPQAQSLAIKLKLASDDSLHSAQVHYRYENREWCLTPKLDRLRQCAYYRMIHGNIFRRYTPPTPMKNSANSLRFARHRIALCPKTIKTLTPHASLRIERHSTLLPDDRHHDEGMDVLIGEALAADAGNKDFRVSFDVGQSIDCAEKIEKLLHTSDAEVSQESLHNGLCVGVSRNEEGKVKQAYFEFDSFRYVIETAELEAVREFMKRD